MAVVYRAFDEHLRVDRAVKLLVPPAARIPEARARLETEARAMASLAHPNVVAVFDIRRDGDDVFLVMELVEGGTLWDWIRACGPMPPRMAVSTIRSVLDAVEAAHEASVIHRDLKPHNIMIDVDGTPKVADFGIAHVRAPLSDDSFTRTGTVLGTWAFMASEQRHSARSVDRRSDIYALGATLFSLLTAEAPFDLFAADQDARLLAGIPSPVADVIRTATRYNPDDRYQTAVEMTAALDATLPLLDPVPKGTTPLGAAPTVASRHGEPTTGLATEAALDEGTGDSVSTTGPAADVLFRRRRLFSELEIDGFGGKPAQPAAHSKLLAAMGPALIALLAGGLVLLSATKSQNRTAAIVMARLGVSSIHVHGDAEEVSLLDSDGVHCTPGHLPLGTYQVTARFPDMDTFVTAGSVDLGENQLVELHCSAASKRCEPVSER